MQNIIQIALKWVFFFQKKKRRKLTQLLGLRPLHSKPPWLCFVPNLHGLWRLKASYQFSISENAELGSGCGPDSWNIRIDNSFSIMWLFKEVEYPTNSNFLKKLNLKKLLVFFCEILPQFPIPTRFFPGLFGYCFREVLHDSWKWILNWV